MSRHVRLAQDGVGHGHAGPHRRNVALGNLKADLHPAEIGDLGNGGGGLRGVDRLPFLHGNRHHRTGQRRGDSGITQIFHVRVHGQFRLAYQGFQFRHFGPGKGPGGFRAFQIFL